VQAERSSEAVHEVLIAKRLAPDSGGDLRLAKPGHLIICADCGIQVGTGHVMRCLALAQTWKRAGGAVTFLVREGMPGIEERIRGEGILLGTLPREGESSPEDFVRAVLRAGPPVAVLDGYSFGAREQAELSAAGIRILTVDDYGHATDYPVRWVLNQNAYAAPEMYPRTNADTRLLLGPTYALLRDEFLPWVAWRRVNPERARKILITIGGSDPDNTSSQILGSLKILERKDLEVALVVGSANPHLDALKAAAERSPVPVHIARNARNMPELMAWADLAISGAGVTSYELCYMGLPSFLLVVAENQRRIAERLSELGVAVKAGTIQDFRTELFADQLQALIEDTQRRESMSRGARELVDGLGSDRVRAALLDRELKLRVARESDCRLLFEWATDPVARSASFHPAAISWEEHTRWFAERLQDPHSVIYIGQGAAGEPVGLVRFQIKDEIAVLSVNVAAEFRGEGWGRVLLALSTRTMLRTLVRASSIRRIDAFVKPENQASVRLFETSGFRQAGKERVADQDALIFTWECGSGTHVN
jgi:UDP-2,4-diacetamido-2,4,6-trideoxy-beta-L-altropyranose hydrolase